MVVIGPSGCGKTTTLKTINRLIEPDSGHIYIDGQDITKVDMVQLQRHIGYVIQQIGLFPNMTVAENICVVPKLLKYDKQRCEQIVRDMLKLVGMEAHAGKYPGELSGGQQRRIGVLRALAASPPIVLMDEPFGALDPQTREILQDEVKKIQQKLGKTVIFVTHDMDEALKLADTIIFMDGGVSECQGAPGDTARGGYIADHSLAGAAGHTDGVFRRRQGNGDRGHYAVFAFAHCAKNAAGPAGGGPRREGGRTRYGHEPPLPPGGRAAAGAAHHFNGRAIAVVNAIGTAVFAAFVGGGLGGVITRSIRIQNIGLLLQATGALILIAVAADLIMGWFEGQLRRTRRVTKKMWLPVGVVMGAFLVLVPFAGQKPQGLLLYDGDYSETQLMVRMAKLLIEDRTGLEVTIQDQMSQVNNFNALKGDNHSCDLMMSYDGTLLTTFLGLDPTDVPEGESIYSYADSVAEERYGLRLLHPLGFDNTYAIAATQAAAEKYALSKISDLQPVAGQLAFGAEHEFFTQEGSMKFNPFSEYYGLRFKDVVSVDVSLKYAAAEKGSFDVTEVYTTDGLNRKAGLVVLEDDKSFFPEYNGAFLIREDMLTRFADTAPELEETLDLLAGKITNEDMVEMTYQVDVQGHSTDEVAKEFLQKQGLLW